MILIKEINYSFKNTFGIFLIDDYTNEKSLIKEVNIFSASKSIKGVEHHILYTSYMTPIREAFTYLNYTLKGSSPNTIKQSITALRLLYSYLELFDLDIKSLTDEDIVKLKYFLRGISPKGAIISLDLSTTRNGTTINSYLSVYRKYAKSLNLKESSLIKLSDIKSTVMIEGSEIGIQMNSYEHREKSYISDVIPAYISVKDFEKILELIRSDYSLREECIIRLMYEGGLRIGEVLGLTSEDVKIQTITDERANSSFKSGVLYLRNRITDKNYQLAKRRIVVKNKRTYSTKDYKGDVKKAYVSTNLIDLINDYVNEFHDNYNRKSEVSKKLFNKNYNKFTLTDIVDPDNYVDEENYKYDENYYIFINSIGKPISISTWNNILREIFIKVGIKIDKNKRENNLNHRFRHGFAMFLVKVKNIQALDLMRLMRHNSLASTVRYYKPTPDDIAILKEDFSKTLEELIPMICSRGIE